jgi:hypothetical protein
VSESRDDGQPGDSGEPQGSAPQSGGSPSQSSDPQDSSPQDSGPHDNSPHDSGPHDSGPSARDPWGSATDPQDRATQDSRPRSNDQQRSNGHARTGGQPGGRGQAGRGRGSSRGSDPVADFQRWMMKAGARSMANQVADQVRRTIGAERKASGDVWDTATNEVPPTESPECQWCPICQAARAARTGNTGGLGARLADAGGALAGVVEGAFSAFEQVMKTQEQNRQAERGGSSRPGPGAEPDRGEAGQ